MTAAGLTYGEAEDVHDYLMSTNGVSHSDLVGALANAMKRIADLERETEELRRNGDTIRELIARLPDGGRHE